MAKINYHIRGSQDQDSSFVSLASLGVILCMIVSLVGIKIWWFKHRLTFDQSSTRNGAAGGSQPAVVVRRSRTSKDKRLSQQIREPVVVHGVFRKRNEDELDIVQPNQLPPVRIRKLSQSTPSLFFPPSPRRRNETQSTAFEDFQPPAREPPKPPVESLPTTPIQEVVPPFEEFAQQFRKVDINRVEELEIIEESGNDGHIFEPPQVPKRLNRGAQDSGHKFLRAKAAAEPENQKFAERRVTGYLRPSEEDLEAMKQLDNSVETSIEEFGERRPTGYIKYAEIDVEGFDDFRHKWDTLELEKNLESSNETRLFEEDDTITSVKERRPTGYVRSSERMWEDADLDIDNERTSVDKWLEIENTQTKTVEIKASEEDEPVRGSKDYIFSPDRPSSVIETVENSLKDCTFMSYTENTKEPQRCVKFLVEEEEEDKEDAADTVKMVRRPTGYVRSTDKLWEDEDLNESSARKDHHLWLEMERDVEKDFTSTVEEEFNKIRHSYEANEGDFLEIRDEFDRGMMKPKGFGKSIDEDWENFEHLQNPKENLNEMKQSEGETIDFGENERKETYTVKFKLTGLEHTEEKESSLRTERRATGYVRNIGELYKDLDIEDEFGFDSKVKFNLEEDLQEIKTESSALKERRPTGFVKRDHSFEPDIDEEEAVELQLKTFEDFEPEEIRKPKPRQKVTFDFNTEEYYVPANDETDSEEDLSFVPPAVPKPMQRMTKMQYTEEPVKTESPTAILFGTQVSFEDPSTPSSNDSWSAIRQHRYLTEEFQQLPLSQTEIVVTPAPREPPKPAYRNPLAQMAASNPVKTEIEVEEEVFIKPRTMRDMKKAQSRQYSNQLSFDDYATTTSTTEA